MKHATAVALTAALVLTGCTSNPPGPPHGSPVLLEVHWTAGPTRTLVFPRDPDASVVIVPGAVSKIDFVFDRRLDGNRIEDRVNGRPVTKLNPPITVSWPDFSNVMSVPPFSADVFYNSLAEYGGETSYAFVRPIIPGFPSDTTVTFNLDRNALTSVYGEPMEGPEQIEVPIGPMTIRRPTTSTADALETVPPTYMFRVDFDNRPAPGADLAPFVRVTANGTPVPL